jgi:DNA-binding MarR family transcriptional regulator
MIKLKEAQFRKLEEGTENIEFLDALDRAFSIFRDIYPDMSIRQAALFVKIAKKEGINHAELTETLNIPQTSVSRNVLRMARRVPHDKDGSTEITGLDLIENRQDIHTPKKHAVHLTERGQALRDRLVGCFGCLKTD